MNPKKLKERLRANRQPAKGSNKEAGFIDFRVGRSQSDRGLVPVSVLNQGWPVYVSSEVFLGSSGIASIGPCLNNECEVSIRLNTKGVKRVNGLREMDEDFSLVLYVNDHPIQNIAITQVLTKYSEVRIPFDSSFEREEFLHCYRASRLKSNK